MHDLPRSQPADESLSPLEVYRRLFEQSLDLLCVAGLDGYFKKVNPAWTRVLGWSEAELLSRPIEDFMHPEDRERTLGARAGLERGVAVRGLENRYVCKDGSVRWLAWQSAIEPTGRTIFAVARDVTERRQLAHEQLVMSKLESMGILTAGIAHDFNNLLAGLSLALDMIGLDETTPEERGGDLERARKTIQAGRALTERLLAFADGDELPFRVIELNELLPQSVALALIGSKFACECEMAATLWPVVADETQISQVIGNLVLNAREATTAGGRLAVDANNVALEAGRVGGLPPGDYVCIRVTDSGAGIPAQILAKVFDPYFSTKQRGTQKGMGLGLTICRTVLQRHGGRIVLDSAVGRGTTATCYLPAVPVRRE